MTSNRCSGAKESDQLQCSHASLAGTRYDEPPTSECTEVSCDGDRGPSVLDLFAKKDVVKICAPMVRYSKLPFRTLVRKYGCDLAYTPMIVSESFVKSQKARDSEFVTNESDRPLVVQFAASNASDLALAAEFVYRFSDGIDLNCGCPQRWAMKEGYGAHLIKHPQLIKDMVIQTRNGVGNFPCSIKIRIHKDIKKTIELCREAEHAGVSWIAVHGRTTEQRKNPVNYEAIKLIKENVQIPIVANGDIKCMADVEKVKAETNVDGVMAAQGLLNNPAMYAGYNTTPRQCVKDWVNISLSLGTPFNPFHHHSIFMLEKLVPKNYRMVFNNLSSTVGVLEFLNDHLEIKFDDCVF